MNAIVIFRTDHSLGTQDVVAVAATPEAAERECDRLWAEKIAELASDQGIDLSQISVADLDALNDRFEFVTRHPLPLVH